MPRLSSILSALSDLVFKFIFGTEERKELLRELVNIVLARVGLPLAAKLTLRNPFNLKQFEGDKESILDIGATDETGPDVRHRGPAVFAEELRLEGPVLLEPAVQRPAPRGGEVRVPSPSRGYTPRRFCPAQG